MRLWVDSTNFQEIQELKNLVKISGINVNQLSLIKDHEKSSFSMEEIIRTLLQIQDGFVVIQLPVGNYQTLINQAIRIFNLDNNRIIIKISVTEEGYIAINKLVKQGVKIMANAIRDFHQIINCLELEVEFITCYIGGIIGDGQGDSSLLKKIIDYRNSYNYKTQIMAGGIEHVSHILTCSDNALDHITLSPSILKEFIKENLHTKAWLDKQDEQWQMSRLKNDLLFKP